MTTENLNRHKELVDFAVEVNRHLWKIRMKTGLSVAEVLTLKTQKGEDAVTRKLILRVREIMSNLRAEWPRLSDLEIVDLTATITQAASRSLSFELSRPGRPPKPPKAKGRPLPDDDPAPPVSVVGVKKTTNAVHR